MQYHNMLNVLKMDVILGKEGDWVPGESNLLYLHYCLFSTPVSFKNSKANNFNTAYII